jgi:hypothetical protein
VPSHSRPRQRRLAVPDLRVSVDLAYVKQLLDGSFMPSLSGI